MQVVAMAHSIDESPILAAPAALVQRGRPVLKKTTATEATEITEIAKTKAKTTSTEHTESTEKRMIQEANPAPDRT